MVCIDYSRNRAKRNPQIPPSKGGLRRPHHALVVGDGKTAQDLGLGHVQGDNVSQGHQVRDQRIDSLLLDETRAAGGNHDRVEHHVARLMETQTLGDDVDDLDGGDHADLHRFGADILEHRIDLRPDHFGRDILHRAHAAGVLRRDGGDDRFRVQTIRCNGFDIGLDARSAA